MKQYIYRLFFFFLSNFFIAHLMAQAELFKPRARIAFDYGAIKPIGLQANIDNSRSILSCLSFEKPFIINKKAYFTTGIGLQQQMYYMDAYFQKVGSNIVFKTVDIGTINNELVFTELKIPMLVSFRLFSKNQNSVVFSSGVDFNLFVNGQRRFKQYGASKTIENFSVDNKIQVPIRVEISTLNQSKGKSFNDLFFFGFGIRQQVTNYLNNGSNSFKPFDGYFRLGINL